ncbi:glycosyltransferase [candidate division WOR-3 bacterium]|nr:glycosyltransferase [candidate division WOR-3 bacterium]
MLLSFILARTLEKSKEHRCILDCVKTSKNSEILFSEDYGPEALNRVLPGLKGEFFTVVVPGVQIKREAAGILKKFSPDKENAGIFYSDYCSCDGKKTALLDYNGDWTERWNFGKLRIYRKSFVMEENLFDENLPQSFNYDMHLKFWGKRDIVRIPEAMYSFETVERKNSIKDKLFFPSQGEYGGFSYLYYSDSQKEQIEKCFMNFLVRQGVYFYEEPRKTASKRAEEACDVTVSVVIPVHNRADFLKSAVSSVLEQDTKEWELIVVDNASDDRTYETALELSQKDPRIRVFRRDDNRIAKALNLGVKKARGQFIAQLDSDDLYSPSTLRLMIKALKSDLTAGLAVSYYDLIDCDGNVLNEMGVVRHEEYSVNNILRVDGAGAVRVWRKSAIEEMGYFDEGDFCDYGEDYDMVLKVTEKYRLKRVREVLYHYRRHPGNSDVLRSEIFKLNAKNQARLNAYKRRKEIIGGSENE